MAINKASQLGEGGIMKLAPIGNLLIIEKGIVVFSCRLNCIMLRSVSLNDNLSP
jgi:hypothetical protein